PAVQPGWRGELELPEAFLPGRLLPVSQRRPGYRADDDRRRVCGSLEVLSQPGQDDSAVDLRDVPYQRHSELSDGAQHCPPSCPEAENPFAAGRSGPWLVSSVSPRAAARSQTNRVRP